MRGDFCYTLEYEIHKQSALDNFVNFGPSCGLHALGRGAFCSITIAYIVQVSKPEKGF